MTSFEFRVEDARRVPMNLSGADGYAKGVVPKRLRSEDRYSKRHDATRKAGRYAAAQGKSRATRAPFAQGDARYEKLDQELVLDAPDACDEISSAPRSTHPPYLD